MNRFAALVALVSILTLSAAAAPAQLDPQLEQMLQKMSATLAAEQRIQFTAHPLARYEAPGMLQQMSTTLTVSLERPRKFAVRTQTPHLGRTIITDGTTVTTYNLQRKTYKSDPAPDDLDTLLQSSSTGIAGAMRDPMSFLGQLLSKAPYETLLRDATQVRRIGSETIGGTPCDHLQITQSHLQWDLWLASAEPHLPARVAANVTSGMLAGTPNRDGATYSAEILIKDWKLGGTIPADTFTFTPPDTAHPEKAAAPQVQPSSKLLGKPAPPFKLPLLAGGEVDLATLKGKVVVLDFWATWCGPCRSALPIVSSTALDLKTSGVEFLAMNVKEEESDVSTYLTQAKLNFPVPMDKDGEVSESYKVEGIPQTVLIGKDGTVQVVHVGFGPDMKPQLKREIEDLIAGKVLATSESIAAAKAPAPATPEKDERATPDVKKTKTAPDANTTRGAELAWRIEGAYTAVAADTTAGLIVAANLKGEALQLTPTGETKSQFKLPGSVSALRIFKSDASTKPALLGYQSWGRSLSVMDLTGKELQSIAVPEGINEVTSADINGDGRYEVIIAANSMPGLQVFNADGTSLWKAEKLARAARVANTRYSTDGEAHVIASASDGKLYDFSSTGAQLRKFDAKVFASLVRATHTSPTILLVAGTTKGGEGVAAVETDGKQKWATPLSTSTRAAVDNALLSPDETQLAVAMRGGAIHVLDVATGEVHATIPAQGIKPELAWIQTEKGNLLLIATGTELNAIRLTK